MRSKAVVDTLTIENTADILDCMFTRDGTRLVSGSMDGRVRHNNVVSSISIDETGKRLASTSWDRNVNLYDVTVGDYRKQNNDYYLGSHNGCITNCTMNSNGLLLATTGMDKMIKIWDLKLRGQTTYYQGHDDWVLDACFSPDGNKVASAGKDGLLIIWNAAGQTQANCSKDSGINSTVSVISKVSIFTPSLHKL
ncbi:hypothetical protein Ciccas_002236 [Cichlidogyrus casuarinus]|uniref:Uncharacterized protein n=1 Tax=Cichlidogyrus casuarinus TaxID=1844966 RepID=A0ABD2QIR5_9PLAT